VSEEQLVISILERVELQTTRILDRVSGCEVEIAGQRIETAALKEQVKVANGRTGTNESAIKQIHARHLALDNVAKGRKEQRMEYIAAVGSLRAWAKAFWPLVAGAAMGGAGVIGLIWGWTH